MPAMKYDDRYHVVDVADNKPEFHIDTVMGSHIYGGVQPDVIITIDSKSFYFEVCDGEIVIREYQLKNGIPVDEEGIIIHKEAYHG